MFAPIEGATALARKRPGIYIESQIYERNKRLYFKASGGFIRILSNIGSDSFNTSHGSFRVIELGGLDIKDYIL